MALIAAQTIARLANWATEEVLTDTCDILRKTDVRRPSAGADTTYPTKYTGVPCAVLNTGVPQEMLTAGQEVGFVPKIILLPKGQDILGSDRIQVGSVIYHVIDLYAPETFEVVRKVLARRGSLAG